MKSVITLYKNTKLLLGKNFKVDDLETYLATFNNNGKLVLNDFQYIKHDLAITIKIAENQSMLEMISENAFNYAKIQNGSQRAIYYFITAMKWISESCIQLSLAMDTINTFASDIVLSSKSMIHRQHKDRFEKITDPIHYEVVPKEIPFPGFYSNIEYAFKDFRTQGQDQVYFEVDAGTLDRSQIILRIYNKFSNERINTIDRIKYLIMGTKFDDPHTYVLGIKYHGSSRIDTRLIPDTFYFGVELDIEPDIDFNQTAMDKCSGTIRNKIGAIKPLVDFNSEGLTPVLFKKSEEQLLDFYEGNQTEELNSFYLIYKNRDNPTEESPNPPVDCFLCSEEKMTPFFSQSTTLVRLNSFDTIGDKKKCAAILYQDGNENGIVKFDNGDELRLFNENECIFIFTQLWFNAAKNKYMEMIKAVWDETEQKWTQIGSPKSYKGGGTTLEKITSFRILDLDIRGGAITQLNNKDITPTSIENARNAIPNSPTSNQVVSSIYDVDRTDPKLVKIIKLPYSPTPIEKTDEGKIVFDTSMWEISQGNFSTGVSMLKLRSLNSKFLSSPNFQINPFEVLAPKELQIVRRERSQDLEPKLLHSDYFQYKFVYDSFSFIFKNEFVKEYIEKLIVNFKATTTINSRFMFEFSNYDVKSANEDYHRVMLVARNNEIVLYNSAYINYIKTGYNYDVKSKERAQTNAVVSTAAQFIVGGLSLAGGIAAAATGAGGVAAAPLIIAGSSLLVSSTASAITTANTIAQQEANVQQKLHQASMQSVSVVGSDDVDLMTYYTENNKAKLCLYEISDKLKKALFDVFYFGGYIAEIQGIPDTTSRCYFNFVSADIVISSKPNMPDNVLADLVERYKNGITFLHHYNNEWDFEQVLENWETSLIN